MANLSDRLTDEKLAEMESHIADIYRSASDDLQKKANAYFDLFAERYEKEYEAFLAGKYTADQFRQWYIAQVGRGERWQQLKTNMAQQIGRANETAIKYINGQTPSIFALNANYSAYEIEKGSGIAFDLVNEDAVEALFKGENHSEFRVLSRNPARDYQWNRTKIQDALLSGILQGEGIDKLANRFLGVMGSNEKAAVRNARTAVTSAQNGGRQHTFNRAEEMGIEVEKEWIATLDSRTRDSHMHLDGVVVKNNEEFPNGLMYPGDPDGEPAEVYNCRCTMRAIIPKYNSAPRTGNTAESYNKWINVKESRISAIEHIERNMANGKASAITIANAKLTNAQKKLLEKLPSFDSRVIMSKKEVSMGDLAALTAITGDEFAMFTRKNERLIVRGDATTVNILISDAKRLYEQGYKWSGHTHPGTDPLITVASPGDHDVLSMFKGQKSSVIYDSMGRYSVFDNEGYHG